MSLSKQSKSFARSRGGPRLRVFAATALALGLSAGYVGYALSDAPPANSVIGNQASASYTDASGQSKSATSNLVETTVRQVGSFSLVQDNTKTAAIGNTVYMPHTLTNTGNGSDTFTITTGDVLGADNDFATNVAIYLDANGDGVPDTTSAVGSCTGVACSVTTPSLPSGGIYRFVVSMAVPATATAPQSDQFLITATGGTLALYDGDGDGTFGEVGDNVKTNTDTLTVTGNAAFQVSKSISASQGPSGVQLTYTLTYRNIGAASGNLALNDVIGSGATVGYSYEPGSAVWSAGASGLTDAYTVGTADVTVGSSAMHYKAATVGAVTTLDATVTNVGPNVTGTVTFKVNVLGTALVGTSTTTNTGSYGLDTDADPTNNTLTQPTNPSPYEVLASYSAVLNDGTSSTDGNNTRPAVADDDTTANADLLRQASASPGQTLTYNNVVWNTGNTTDTFNVTAAALAGGGGYGAWPTGTSFQLFKSDGATPLTDSNGDGVADTGPMARNTSYTVVLKVTLPGDACSGGTCPTGPFDIEKIATSVGDTSKTSKTYDRLAAITLPKVDLANSTVTVDTAVNADAVVAGTPTTTLSTLPGGAVVFDLYARNESGLADSYTLSYSGSNAFPGAALPAGWTVQFRTATAATCTADGSVITSIGPVAAGAEVHFCAVVTTSGTSTPATTPVYFQVTSLISGATDSKQDAVTVSEVNQIALEPSHTGQIYPGGTVVYAHTLSNTGNTTCAAPFTFTITESLATQGWTYVLYKDVDGNGEIGATDTVISAPATTGLAEALAPAAQVKLLVKVFAPAGAAAATIDKVEIQAHATCSATAVNSSAVTDTTTVVTGQVRLTKAQALDTNCAAAATADYNALTFSTAKLQAYPGDCIVYKVTATNEGLGNVSALSILDTLPTFTDVVTGTVALPNPICSAGTDQSAGTTISCGNAISLTPAASATMTFRVKVQQ